MTITITAFQAFSPPLLLALVLLFVLPTTSISASSGSLSFSSHIATTPASENWGYNPLSRHITGYSFASQKERRSVVLFNNEPVCCQSDICMTVRTSGQEITCSKSSSSCSSSSSSSCSSSSNGDSEGPAEAHSQEMLRLRTLDFPVLGLHDVDIMCSSSRTLRCGDKNNSSSSSSSSSSEHRYSTMFLQLESPPALWRTVPIVFPPFGYVTTQKLDILVQPHAQSQTQQQQQQSYDRMAFNVEGIVDTVLPGSSTTLSSGPSADIEPASWFFTITPQSVVPVLSSAVASSSSSVHDGKEGTEGDKETEKEKEKEKGNEKEERGRSRRIRSPSKERRPLLDLKTGRLLNSEEKEENEEEEEEEDGDEERIIRIRRENEDSMKSINGGHGRDDGDYGGDSETKPMMMLMTGLPNHGYIEFVLSDEDIARNRHFHSKTNGSRRSSSGSGSRSGSSVEEEEEKEEKKEETEEDIIAQELRSKSIAMLRAVSGTYKDPESALKLLNAHAINVCVWTSNKLDGQKRIWLQQFEHLDAQSFHFKVIISLTASDIATQNKFHELNPAAPDSMLSMVQKLNVANDLDKDKGHRRNNKETKEVLVDIVDSPFNQLALSLDMLDEVPMDGSSRPPASAVWHNKESLLYEYVHQSFVIANYTVEAVSPSWCKMLYVKIIQFLQTEKCEVLVYGNNRGFTADVLMTDAARLLEVPTATELLNLYLEPSIVPDVVIAPSHYAQQHRSIADSVRSTQYPTTTTTTTTSSSTTSTSNTSSATSAAPYRWFGPAQSVVISPSVDSQRIFNPIFWQQQQKKYQHPSCIVTASSTSTSTSSTRSKSPCFIIGFIGRLAPEKNPGLFLLSAYEILQKIPYARFTIVGDGVLRPSLEILAARLGILWAVHFAGWMNANDELPLVLSSMNVVINPSLRAWSETFCIANIEAMSMGVPLVTFAVGGVGEYVSSAAAARTGKDHISGRNHDATTANNEGAEAEPPPFFEVSHNAVVVNTASAAALSSAVLYLYLNEQVATSLAAAARATVVDHFGLSKQMQRYSDLYKMMYYARLDTSDRGLLKEVVQEEIRIRQFQYKRQQQQQQQEREREKEREL